MSWIFKSISHFRQTFFLAYIVEMSSGQNFLWWVWGNILASWVRWGWVSLTWIRKIFLKKLIFSIFHLNQDPLNCMIKRSLIRLCKLVVRNKQEIISQMLTSKDHQNTLNSWKIARSLLIYFQVQIIDGHEYQITIKVLLVLQSISTQRITKSKLFL